MQVAGDLAGRQHRERGGRAPAVGGLVVSALFFFLRGGSAQVARSLARAHARHIREKLAAPSRAEGIIRARERGYL